VTYPQAISLMPDFAANLFGVVFFGSLVIAGLSSAISLVEAFSSAVIDKFHYPRGTVVSVVCITGFVGSIIFTAKSGLYWIDIVDHFITHYGLVVIGLLECIVIGWIFKASKLREHIDHATGKTLTRFWDVCIKVITPLVLIMMLVNDLRMEILTPYEGYSWMAILMIGRDWLVIALIVALFISMRPWKKHWEKRKSN
ncbi:MAG: sodium-dependent transporter, partial [Candidatus Omnitrophica bacterium]|nr:sodium-dependent transporter [Candidatus Omnitrophota bacterium]